MLLIFGWIYYTMDGVTLRDATIFTRSDQNIGKAFTTGEERHSSHLTVNMKAENIYALTSH